MSRCLEAAPPQHGSSTRIRLLTHGCPTTRTHSSRNTTATTTNTTTVSAIHPGKRNDQHALSRSKSSPANALSRALACAHRGRYRSALHLLLYNPMFSVVSALLIIIFLANRSTYIHTYIIRRFCCTQLYVLTAGRLSAKPFISGIGLKLTVKVDWMTQISSSGPLEVHNLNLPGEPNIISLLFTTIVATPLYFFVSLPSDKVYRGTFFS